MAPPPDSDDWRAWRNDVDVRFETGDRAFKRIEKNLRDLIGAVDGLRGLIKARGLDAYDDGDEDDVSGITDIEEVKRRARRQRTQARQGRTIRRWGKAIAPVLVVAGGVLWEAFKQLVLK